VFPGTGAPSNSMLSMQGYSLMNGLSGTFIDK
jgi:hypothetical protein